MKRMFNYSFLSLLLLSTVASAKVVPYISIRSQSENAARELVLWQTQINLFDMDRINGSFSITPEYTRTFQPERLAQYLFCDVLDNDRCETKCSTFKIQGSLVGADSNGRDPKALLADYFGLPLDYSSFVSVEPRIDQFLVDFNFYLGLDEWLEGLYFRIHAPIVHTRWDLNFCETVNVKGTSNLPLGYFNGDNGAPTATPQQYFGATRENLVSTFESFVSRGEVPNIKNITFQPLMKAKMSRCSRDDTKMSDIQMALGWNFWIDEDYHVGLNIRGAGPTGNRPEGEWLFEPIVGNGKHWELGAGLTSHWVLWRSEDECNDFSMYLDANVTHLFKDRQCRTFDICGKPLSRYMLAEKMSSDVTHLHNDAAGTLTPSYQFENEFAPVANLSTIPVDVSAAVQGDVVLKFAYTHHNFQFDIGYNFWGRSCEEICPRCDCSNSEVGFWALKGDAFVYAFRVVDDVPQFPGIPLSATEQNASIFCGTNNAQRLGTPYWEQNPGVDNANEAWTDSTPAARLQSNRPDTDNFNPAYSSFDASGVFSTSETKQWDIQGARTKGLSNKFFVNLGYIWQEHCDWIPYLGVGAEAEFGIHDKNCCCNADTTCETMSPADPLPNTLIAGIDFDCCTNNCCDNNKKDCCGKKKCEKACCTNAALSQWGIWVKGGISFN